MGPCSAGSLIGLTRMAARKAARMRRQIVADHDGPEGVPQEVGLRTQFERAGQAVQEPGVTLDVVAAGGQRFGFAEAGQIRGDHAVSGQLVNHQFQPMVITAEAVDHQQGGRAVVAPGILPITHPRAVEQYLAPKCAFGHGGHVRLPADSMPSTLPIRRRGKAQPGVVGAWGRPAGAARRSRALSARGNGRQLRRGAAGCCRRVGTTGSCGNAQLTLPCAAG